MSPRPRADHRLRRTGRESHAGFSCHHAYSAFHRRVRSSSPFSKKKEKSRMPLSLEQCCLSFAVLLPVACWAQTAESEDWNAKFQATYIWQYKRPFAAAYSGVNSLSSERENSYSFSSTGFLGFRPWTGGAFYVNPQVSQSSPFSHQTGLAGFTVAAVSATHDGPRPPFTPTRILLR